MAAALRHTDEQENQVSQACETYNANEVFQKLLRQTVGRELPQNTIIQKQIPTADGIQAFAVGKPNGMPRAVFKFADSHQAAASLLHHARMLKTHDRMLKSIDLAFEIPTVYALYQNNSTIGVLESMLPGVTLEEYIQNKGSEQLPQIMKDISVKLSSFHDPQRLIINVVEQEINTLVHEPIDLIEKKLGWVNQKLVGRKLDSLRQELAEALSWQQLSFAPVHGNLHPRHIILDPITYEMTGLTNWEMGQQSSYPAVDLFHLIMTVISQIDRKELGSTVLQALRMPRRFSSEIYSSADQNKLATAGSSDRIVIILAWLQHLKSNLLKNEIGPKGSLWHYKNVVQVLSKL